MMDVEALYRRLCMVAASDGRIGLRERSVLERTARSIGLTEERARSIEEQALAAPGDLGVRGEGGEEDRIEELVTLVRVVAADGKVTPEEREVLDRYVRDARIEGVDLDVLLADVRPAQKGAREQTYWNLFLAANVDGCVSPEERRILDRERIRLGISAEAATEIERRVAQDPRLRIQVLPTLAEKLDTLILVAGVAAADGEIEPREKRLLEKLWQLAAIPEVPLDTIIASAMRRARESGALPAPAAAAGPVLLQVRGLRANAAMRCACCMGPADRTSMERRSLRGVRAEKLHAELEIPSCPECRAHRRRRSARFALLAGSAIVLALSWTLGGVMLRSFAGLSLSTAGDALLFSIASLVAFVVLPVALAYGLLPPSRPEARHPAEGPPVRIQGASLSGMTLAVANPRYAALVRALHPGASRVPGRPRLLRRWEGAAAALFGTSKSPTVLRALRWVPIATTALAVLAWGPWSLRPAACWTRAAADGTPEAMERYFGAFGTDARRENSYADAVVRAGQLRSVQEFMRLFPESERARDVQRRAVEIAVTSDKPQTYEEVLGLFPDRAPEIEERYARAVLRDPNRETAGHFLDRYPLGDFRPDVEIAYLDAAFGPGLHAYWVTVPADEWLPRLEEAYANWSCRVGGDRPVKAYIDRFQAGMHRSRVEVAWFRWLASTGDVARVRAFWDLLPEPVGLADIELACGDWAVETGSPDALRLYGERFSLAALEKRGVSPSRRAPVAERLLELATRAPQRESLEAWIALFADQTALRGRLDAAYRAWAKADGTPEGYLSYLSAATSPEGLAAAERFFLDQAVEWKSTSLLSRYLQALQGRPPSDGPRVDQVFAELALLARDKAPMKEYLHWFPRGVARAKVGESYWQVTTRDGTIESLEDFLEHVPEPANAAAVEARHSELAIRDGSRRALRSYAAHWPSGAHRGDVAKAYLAQVKSLEDLDGYCEVFTLASDRGAMESRFADLVLQDPTWESCRRYAERFPQGVSRSRIAEALWARARKEDEIEVYRQYIGIFAEDPHAKEAECRIIELQTMAGAGRGGLPEADRVGKSGKQGTSIYYLNNDTGQDLTIAFSGPEVFRITISANRRVGFEMANGTYHVSATVGGDVEPYGGQESLENETMQIRLHIVTTVNGIPMGVPGFEVAQDPSGWPIVRRVGELGELGKH